MKYPTKHLSGKAIKRVLADRLVAPVVAFGDNVCVFRVIWRSEGDSEGLVRAWDYIMSQHHLCDQVVAQSPSLQMFVSCISGIFNTGRPILEQANPVYPAVSYWTVFDGAATVNLDLIWSLSEQLRAACPSAMVRRIKSLRIREHDHTHSDSGTLFTVLKDHCSWFVCQKIVRSLVACGAAAVRVFFFRGLLLVSYDLQLSHFVG